MHHKKGSLWCRQAYAASAAGVTGRSPGKRSWLLSARGRGLRAQPDGARGPQRDARLSRSIGTIIQRVAFFLHSLPPSEGGAHGPRLESLAALYCDQGRHR